MLLGYSGVEIDPEDLAEALQTPPIGMSGKVPHARSAGTVDWALSYLALKANKRAPGYSRDALRANLI
jgi:hypothetical protein